MRGAAKNPVIGPTPEPVLPALDADLDLDERTEISLPPTPLDSSIPFQEQQAWVAPIERPVTPPLLRAKEPPTIGRVSLSPAPAPPSGSASASEFPGASASELPGASEASSPARARASSPAQVNPPFLPDRQNLPSELPGASASELPGARTPCGSPARARASSPAQATQPHVPDRQSLQSLWPEPPRKRPLPGRLRLALAGAVSLLVVIIAFGSRGAKPQAEAAPPLDDGMVVSADDLRNRHEVRADDFRSRGERPGPAAATAPGTAAPGPAAAGPATTETVTPEALAERRARRERDPEDVLALRARRAGAARTGTRGGAATAEAPLFEGPVYVTAGAAAGATDSPGPPSGSSRPADASREPLAAAGSSVPAVLAGPLEVRGGSATIVARVDGPTGPLRGARFIGTASATTGRVTIHFRTVLLADGRQARVDAEAQDEEGGFGLPAAGQAAEKEDDRGSVLGDVAEATATDVVSSAIGVGVAGRAVDRALTGSRARRGEGGPARAGALPAGTRLQVFLHEAVDLGR